jgi:hypothetical protein
MEYFGFKFGKITIINILKKALTTVGHTGCKAWGEKADQYFDKRNFTKASNLYEPRISRYIA